MWTAPLLEVWPYFWLGNCNLGTHRSSAKGWCRSSWCDGCEGSAGCDSEKKTSSSWVAGFRWFCFDLFFSHNFGMKLGKKSGQFITTSAEVTPNGGLVRESQNGLKLGWGFIINCPERNVLRGMFMALRLAALLAFAAWSMWWAKKKAWALSGFIGPCGCFQPNIGVEFNPQNGWWK